MGIKSFSDLIELWETSEALALDVGESGTNVRAWKYRQNIPSPYWVRVVGAARRRAFHEVTYELLARIAATNVGQRGGGVDKQTAA